MPHITQLGISGTSRYHHRLRLAATFSAIVAGPGCDALIGIGELDSTAFGSGGSKSSGGMPGGAGNRSGQVSGGTAAQSGYSQYSGGTSERLTVTNPSSTSSGGSYLATGGREQSLGGGTSFAGTDTSGGTRGAAGGPSSASESSGGHGGDAAQLGGAAGRYSDLGSAGISQAGKAGAAVGGESHKVPTGGAGAIGGSGTIRGGSSGTSSRSESGSSAGALAATAGVAGTAGAAGGSVGTTCFDLVNDMIALTDGNLSKTTWRFEAAQRVPILRGDALVELDHFAWLDFHSTCLTCESPTRAWQRDISTSFPVFVLNPGDIKDPENVNIPQSRSILGHPASEVYATVVWTAPKSGIAKVSASFRGVSALAEVDVCIVVRRQAVYEKTLVNTTEAQPLATHIQTYSVVAGDQIKFGIGPGPFNNFNNDSTRVEVQVCLR